MTRCACYREFESLKPTIDPNIAQRVIESRCYGTKECDPCSCGGDPTRCDFYPEKRAAAEKSTKEQASDTTTIYYAHHQWKYRTKIEEYELTLIKRYFPHANIFNPSTDLETNSKDETIVMAECLERVRESDILVFSSMDGCIGTGVYHEIKEAREKGKLILYIFHDTLLTDFEVIKRAPFEKTDRLYATICINHF